MYTYIHMYVYIYKEVTDFQSEKFRMYLHSTIKAQYSPLLFIYLFLFAVYFVYSFSCQTDKLDLDFYSLPSLKLVPN